MGNSGNGHVQIIQSCYFHAWFFAKEPSSWLLGPMSQVSVSSCLHLAGLHLLHALDGRQTLIACSILSYISYFGRAVESSGGVT